MSIRGGVYIYLCWFAALYFLVGLFLLAQIRYSALTMEFGHVSSFCLLIVYVKSNYQEGSDTCFSHSLTLRAKGKHLP